MIGKTLGHYQITSQLGKGGMGEVFEAKDKVLGREVAIKVLPDEFARDADRVARFQREAKVLASLNHPNIAAIHGLEQSEGTNFLVLELVEGETLADRIKAGPIPVEETLKLALQIAEGLEAAHEKGVIHRDLKPSNIKVSPDGKVKVLDFGLAKAYSGQQELPSLSASPTLSNLATQQGIILGTAAYMSPEQARGKNIDRRADIWAFGCVVYEMLTGQAAFQGEDVTEILASVVKGGANLELLPANLHPRVGEAITRCLQKDLKRRYSSITDARYEIEQALADPGGVLLQPVAAAGPRNRLRMILPWAAATLALGMIIAGTVIWKLTTSETHQVVRFYYDLPEDQQFSELPWPALAVSPDGRQFVYSTTEGLYLRSIEEFTAKLIPGTGDNPQQPFFSPDGKWIGYFSFSDRKLKKIAVSGGAAVPLCDPSQITGAIWNADNTIVYGQLVGGDIMRISANGGTPQTIAKSASGTPTSPQVLPGGGSILYSTGRNPRRMLVVQSLKSGERRELFEANGARYLPSGHIIYSQGSSLFAVPFDLNALKVTGTQVPVVEGVSRPRGIGDYAVSESGTLVYMQEFEGAGEPGRTLVWVDRKGKEEPVSAAAKAYYDPKISPDGTRVALAIMDPLNYDIWIWDFIRSALTRLTLDPTTDRFTLWTPDGKRIVFHSDRNFGIYWKAADGTGKDEPVGSVPEKETLPWAWSGDGKSLVVTISGYASLVDSDIGMLSMEGDRKYRPLLNEKYSESQPRVSPDGRWIAYTSNESGRNEVYVRPFPGVEAGRSQVSTGGGDSPLWSPTGRELFYRSGDAVMAVAVKTENAFSLASPVVLFRGTYASIAASSGDLSPWDISPDGKRFLMIKQTGPSTSQRSGPRRVNIVLNWFEELKQRVPVK